jgi:hypothetical protein
MLPAASARARTILRDQVTAPPSDRLCQLTAQAALPEYFESEPRYLDGVERRLAMWSLIKKLPAQDQLDLASYYQDGIEFHRRARVERWIGSQLHKFDLLYLAATSEPAYRVTHAR